MTEEFKKAYADAYPDRVAKYVADHGGTQVWKAGKNSAARIGELELEVQRLRRVLLTVAADGDQVLKGYIMSQLG